MKNLTYMFKHKCAHEVAARCVFFSLFWRGNVCVTSLATRFRSELQLKKKKKKKHPETELGGAARCTGPYASTEGGVWKHGESLAELKMKHRWKIENDNE